MRSPVTVERLEQALQTWEEMMWATGVISRGLVAKGDQPLVDFTGPAAHYPELRKHLASLRAFEDFDWDRFTFKRENLKQSFMGANGVQMFLPYVLACWCTHSKRVYHIDEDLQALLMNTNLEDLTWNDVSPPFQAFGISLERPITSQDGNRKCDFISVAPISRVPSGESIATDVPAVPQWPWCVMLFQASLDRWQPTNIRDQVGRRLRRDDFVRAAALVYQKNVLQKSSDHLLSVLARRNADKPVTKSITDLHNAHPANEIRGDLALRLIVGFCMYSRMLPASASTLVLPNEPIRQARPGTPATIIEGSEIFHVTSRKRLTPEERDLFIRHAEGRLTGIELECHFREGHWRRPPGKGNDPEYPKTVQVEPTIVRPDRWPAGGLPTGSKVHLIRH